MTAASDDQGRASMCADLRRSIPPRPWTRWEDGEPVGWRVARSLWKSWVIPYRTAELLGFDDDTGEMKFGPWCWNAPDLWRVFRDR